MFPHSEIVLVRYIQVVASYSHSEIMNLTNTSQDSSLIGWFIGLFNNAS